MRRKGGRGRDREKKTGREKEKRDKSIYLGCNGERRWQTEKMAEASQEAL